MEKSEESTQMDDLVKLSFFSGIGKAISSASTVKETLDAVMDQVGQIFAPAYWSLLLRNPKTGELTFSVVVGSGVEALKGRTIPRGQGIAGWIAEKGEPLIIDDVSRDPRFAPDMDKITAFKTESIIGVPLKNKDTVFGVIELINKLDGRSFSPLELKLLTTIADFAAIAIEKAYYLRALRRVATVDQLTGLNNRRAFLRYARKEAERCRRSGRNFSLMMIDLDGFKQINDRYGHRQGDRTLRQVAELLRRQLRTSDYACRYGGDEFAVLMPETCREEAENLKARLLEKLEEANRQEDVPVGLSIGVTESDGRSLSELLHLADSEMYREKGRKVEMTITDMPENLQEMVDREEKDSGEGEDPFL